MDGHDAFCAPVEAVSSKSAAQKYRDHTGLQSWQWMISGWKPITGIAARTALRKR